MFNRIFYNVIIQMLIRIKFLTDFIICLPISYYYWIFVFFSLSTFSFSLTYVTFIMQFILSAIFIYSNLSLFARSFSFENLLYNLPTEKFPSSWSPRNLILKFDICKRSYSSRRYFSLSVLCKHSVLREVH